MEFKCFDFKNSSFTIYNMHVSCKMNISEILWYTSEFKLRILTQMAWKVTQMTLFVVCVQY